MGRALVAAEQPISKIFSDDYVFTIPGYQRPYSWTTEHANALLDDLLGFIGADQSPIDKMSPYFLGSVVLIKDDINPSAEVVDGQQRLTTLTLLLAGIRSLADADTAKEITPLLYERGSSIRGTQDRFRLTLRERDAAFFQDYVQREDGFASLLQLTDELPDSQNNIRSNALLYSKRLKEIPAALRIRLAQFIVTRCYLVTVATPDLDSAYRIFSVLNSRGLDLAPTDILKAEIIGQIPTTHRPAYTQRWEEAEEDLGRDSFNDLFGHIRMVYRQAKPQGTLIKEFKEHVRLEDPRRFIDELLLPMAKAFEEITDAEYQSTENAGQVNDRLKWLTHLEYSDWIPPALAFMHRYRQKADLVYDFFAELERLSYAMLVMKWGINERVDRFSKLTGWIMSGDLPTAKESPIQLTPHEQYIAYAALDGPLYASHSARAKSTILLRLDSLLSGGGATYDYPTVTIEHVLPQNPLPASKWMEWFPDEKDRLIWVHRLGNLALLTRKKNSSASNYDFDTKKRAYFSKGGVSPFVLTTQVLEKTSWGPDEVRERHRQLLETFEKHWRLQEREVPPAELTTKLLAVTEPDASPVSAEEGAQREKVRTAREQILLNFWARLIDRSRATTPLFANRSASDGPWISAALGKSGFWLSLSLTKEFACVECGIRPSKEASKNKEAFQTLLAQKEEVERTFGAKLDWEELPDKKASRISVSIDGGWITPQEEWPLLQDQMIDAVVRLEKSLRGPISELRP